MGKRNEDGTFADGASGNPAGRPPIPPEIKELADTNAPKAFEKIVGLLESKNERIVLLAANSILDRALGKTPQALHHLGAGGGALEYDASGELLTILQRLADGGKTNGKANGTNGKTRRKKK